MQATVLDSGVGNLHSVARGLEAAGFSVRVTEDGQAALRAECLVLPGVGAFPAAAGRLAAIREPLRERLASGMPCLAICLGMQLLLDASEEGPGAGLGLLAGDVTRLAARRVPHIGWNVVESNDPVCAGLRHAYFAHGFACRPRDPSSVVAWTRHDGDRFPAAIRVRRTLGVQFHPEKSSRDGIALLARFRREISA